MIQSNVVQIQDVDVWRRHGRFCILDAELTESRINYLFNLMRQFLVVDAEYDMSWGGVQYTALSPLFDIVPEGEQVPEYKIIVTELGGEIIHIHAERLYT